MLLFDELSDRPVPAKNTARRAAARAGLVPNPKARLKAQFHEVCRFKHLAARSEEAYLQWIKRFIVFHKGKAEILKAENRNRKAEGNSEHPTSNEAGMTGGTHCPTHHHLTGGTSYFSDAQSGRIIPVVSTASARREGRAHTPVRAAGVGGKAAVPSARPEARSGLAQPLEIPQKADSV